MSHRSQGIGNYMESNRLRAIGRQALPSQNAHFKRASMYKRSPLLHKVKSLLRPKLNLSPSLFTLRVCVAANDRDERHRWNQGHSFDSSPSTRGLTHLAPTQFTLVPPPNQIMRTPRHTVRSHQQSIEGPSAAKSAQQVNDNRSSIQSPISNNQTHLRDIKKPSFAHPIRQGLNDEFKHHNTSFLPLPPVLHNRTLPHCSIQQFHPVLQGAVGSSYFSGHSHQPHLPSQHSIPPTPLPPTPYSNCQPISRLKVNINPFAAPNHDEHQRGPSTGLPSQSTLSFFDSSTSSFGENHIVPHHRSKTYLGPSRYTPYPLPNRPLSGVGATLHPPPTLVPCTNTGSVNPHGVSPNKSSSHPTYAQGNHQAQANPRKRTRPGRASKRWARFREKAESSFVLSDNDDESTESPDLDETITTAGPAEKPFYYFIPPSRQHDPNPSEILTSQETLLSHYSGLSHGTCIIAPRNMPAFCKFKTTPFSSMSSEELQGWEKLVCFFLQQTEYVAPVKNNGPSMGVLMRSQFNAKDEASAFEEANKWIATHLEQLAPRAFKEYREALIDGQLPSMAHMEYPSPYTMFDFASFFTFTMYNFYNEPHKDTDVNNWTLVCWIPIFNPRNCLY
ncbi:Leucine-zipper-like transcriptional regulator 1 [Puccinia graminis f. sp. tritici]|uniref:Leucine-zipper-like transcriptional regulator 1 n=1 Tax=Puccinia graminis f. sp. tritici TaxID=56615 RepID=A0A5B0P3U8_PUCGR|nr:Leucine-zipper-like transcriptional regulator 1 [Puccinia graminis f. sp. tritici]